MIQTFKHNLLITCMVVMGFTASMNSYAIQTQINDTSINTGGAVIDDYVFYNIGGGRAVSMSKHNNMQSIKIGVGWNSNLICGDMNLETTLQNQLNGVTNGFQQIMNKGSVYTDYGGPVGGSIDNKLTGALGDIGLAVSSLSYFPSMDVLRQALPLVLSFLKMALIVCIPIVLLIGMYDLKTVVTVSCVEFALFFVDFWFQLARWIDSTILDALYGWDSPHSNWNPFLGIDNAMGDMLLNFIMATMFIVMPMFWLGALSWVGIRAGSFVQMLTSGTAGARAAGAKGGSTLVGIGKMVVTKGKSK